MSFIYNMADTWNAIGTTFNSILMNISNGAGGSPVGAAASKAINIQANGTTIFSVDIAGAVGIGGANPSIGKLVLPNNQYFTWRNAANNNETVGFISTANNDLQFLTAGQFQMLITAAGSVCVGKSTGVITTTATDGFLYIPTCAGTPTGTPAAGVGTGLVPMIYDTTNHQFWFYDGGGWKQPKTPAGAAIVTWQ